MVSQSLVPQNGQTRALSTPMPVGLEGMDDFSTADMEIPVLKIVHGVSRMEGAEEHIGQLWNSISGEFAKTVDVVILNGRHSRALFSGEASESERPECVSRDGVNGSTHGACSSCPFNPENDPSLWDDKTRKRCAKGYTFFFYLPGSDEFAIFTASKTNVPPVRKLITQFSLKLKVPLFGAIVTLGTEKHEEPGKKWYVIAPKVKRTLAPEEIAEYRAMAAALRGVQIRVVDDETAIEGQAVPVGSAATSDDEPPIDSYSAAEAPSGQAGRLPF